MSRSLLSFYLVSLLISLVISSLIIIPVVGQGAYRTPITVTENSGNDLTDYQVKIVLDSSWDGWDYVSQDGSDIYFLDSNNNPLYYWIEEWDYSNQEAVIWVKVPSIPASGSITIYLYYGGDNPYSSYNSGKATFVKFYDFSVDESSEWVLDVGSWEWDTGNGYLKLKTSESEDRARIKDFTIGIGYAIRARLYGADSPDPKIDPAIIFAFHDENNFYMARFNSYDDELQLYKKVDGSFTKIGSVSKTINANTWYILEVAWVSTDHVKVWLDSVLEIDQTTDLESWTSGGVGVRDYYSESWYDYYIVRKYVDPEPSVTLGSSEPVSSTGFSPRIVSVDPGSLSGSPGDTLSIDVVVRNNGDTSGSVYVRLYDHNGVVRDEKYITCDPGIDVSTSLSFTASEDDRGDWTWSIKVENDTYVYDTYDISVSIHYDLSYDYGYTISVNGVFNIYNYTSYRYGYTIELSVPKIFSVVEDNLKDYYTCWGVSLKLSINNFTVYSKEWNIGDFEKCIGNDDPEFDIVNWYSGYSGYTSYGIDFPVELIIVITVVTLLLWVGYYLEGVEGMVIGAGLIGIMGLHGFLNAWVTVLVVIINIILIYLFTVKKGSGGV